MTIYLPLILYFIVFPLGMYFYFRQKSQVNLPAPQKKPVLKARRLPLVIGKRGMRASPVTIESQETGD